MRKFLTSRFPSAAKAYRALRDSGMNSILAIIAVVLATAVAANADLPVWQLLSVLYA